MKIQVQEVTGLDLVFGGDMKKLLPAMTEIPQEFQQGHTKWNKVVSDWFFYGLKNIQWKPRGGVDEDMALRHVKAVMGSWEPQHEHKEAGCAYLLSEFFDDVTYERAK